MPNHRRTEPERPEATMKQAQQNEADHVVIQRPLPHYARALCDTLAEQMREVFPITERSA